MHSFAVEYWKGEDMIKEDIKEYARATICFNTNRVKYSLEHDYGCQYANFEVSQLYLRRQNSSC